MNRKNLVPFVENYGLLCFSWKHKISEFSRLRIIPTKNSGSNIITLFSAHFIKILLKKGKRLFY